MVDLVWQRDDDRVLLDFTGLEQTVFPGYAVTDGLASKTVRAFDKEPGEAYRQAIACGVSDPVLTYVGDDVCRGFYLSAP